MSEREREEGFLARWARRKSEAAKGRPEEEPAQDVRPTQERMPEPEVQSPLEEPEAEPADDGREPEDPQAELARLGLPDPETLGPDASFRAFFAEGVPGWVKRRAMRRLFRVNPIIRTVDMMDDYAEDFTDAATVTALLKGAGEAARRARERLERSVAAQPRESMSEEPDRREPPADHGDAGGHGAARESRTAPEEDTAADGEPAAANREEQV